MVSFLEGMPCCPSGVLDTSGAVVVEADLERARAGHLAHSSTVTSSATACCARAISSSTAGSGGRGTVTRTVFPAVVVSRSQRPASGH